MATYCGATDNSTASNFTGSRWAVYYSSCAHSRAQDHELLTSPTFGFRHVKKFALIITAANVALIACSNVLAEEEAIDASDPTKIYSYAGGGLKYTDYTNNESMLEVRAMGNFGFGDNDAVMFETAYDFHDGNGIPGDSNAITNIRLRWFHSFDLDSSVVSGYRGWAT